MSNNKRNQSTQGIQTVIKPGTGYFQGGITPPARPYQDSGSGGQQQGQNGGQQSGNSGSQSVDGSGKK